MNILTSSNLNLSQMMAGASSSTVQQGRTFYYHGHTQLEYVNRKNARIHVREGTRPPFQVDIVLADEKISYTCNCSASGVTGGSICPHKVAAGLSLQDYLRYHPIVTWETLLSKAIQETPKRSSSSNQALLFFSLQKRSSTWGVYPYSLPLNAFTAVNFEDRDEIARTVKQNKLSKDAKSVRSKIESSRFVNATKESQLVAQYSTMAQHYYLYYYDKSSGCASLLPLLADALFYLGAEENPLKSPLRVSPTRAVPEVLLDAGKEETRLSTIVRLGEEQFRLDPKEIQIIADDPLWLLANGVLFQVEDSGGPTQFFIQNPEIEIPKEDRDHFLETYLPQIAEKLTVTGDGISWEEVECDPLPRVYLSESQGELTASLRFAYGDFELPYEKRLPATSIQRRSGSISLARIKRIPDAEDRHWRAMSGFGLKRGAEPGEFMLRARTEPVDFLLHQVPRLAEAGYTVYGEQELTSARVNRHRPTLSLNVSSGIDWFDVEAVVNYGDIEVSFKEIKRALKKREKYIKLIDGSIGELPEEWRERYRHLFSLAEETDTGIRLAQHHLTLLDQVLAEADRAQTDPEFERRRQRLRDFDQITPHELPQGFVGELRHYQKSGYDWLHFLHEYEFGGCLADDMGIGKTVQALVFLLSLRERGHAKNADLIVLPRSLIFNWEREAARFTPGLRILTHADQNRATDLAEFEHVDLVLTTYGIMLRDIELLRQYRFHYVVLDESQAIKNPLALTSKAARLLQADHRLVLTGTPVENSTFELWSQFAFLNPGLLGSLEYFKEEFGSAIEKQQSEETAQFLRKMVFPFILRRTKDQVAPELPPRVERHLYSEMDPAQRKLYDKTRDYYRAMLLGMIEEEGINNSRMKVLEGLLRLRQICNHPVIVDPKYRGESSKFEQLLETLETLQSEGHKALIFSQFVQMLTIVRSALDERKITYSYLDGSTRDRQERVDTFQNDPSIPFFLISLKAGGVGLNLTAADYVIHIDPWWNPAVEMQATDRTHRIGQVKPVFVYKLIAKDTVEEKILQLQDRKRTLVNQLIATEGSFFKSLTQDDIKVLFE